MHGYNMAGVLGLEPAPATSLPDKGVLQLLLLNGLAGVVAQVLWARSVLLTSPLLATCGLSLTAPVAMLADTLLRGQVSKPPCV